MADYKSYLAASILTEDKAVTYRLLSRALKVHVNAAKEMLYDFHSQQNAKKRGTIHATYLVSATKRKESAPATNGGVKKDVDCDDYMQSSPFMSSSMPRPEEMEESTGETSVLSIILVRENDLDKLRSEYERINSIHIYSLEPHPLKDLQILSDVSRELTEICASDDPLECSFKYGTITNPKAKRRTARRPPPSASVALTQPESQTVKGKPAETKPALKKEESLSKPSTANEFFGKGKEKPKAKPATINNGSSKESTPNPPPLKREASSLMKSFAKVKPKLKREGTDSSAVASLALSAGVDSPMKDVSDDDEEETYVPPISNALENAERTRRKTEREAQLRAMMEDSDGEEPVAKPKRKSAEESEDEEGIQVKRAKSESVENEEAPVVSSGRRRGRRRVMKKKVMKDEDGYLVTKEEAAWESFSEDEPVPKSKPKSQSSAPAAKKKGPAKAAGQGNIMSFFGKK